MKKYNINNPMAPLWLIFPEISRGSIGWRMGYGEDYAIKFWEWYDLLTEEDKIKYQNLFPEPIGWQGIYKGEINDIYDNEGNLCWIKNEERKYSLENIKQDHRSGKKNKYIYFWGHQPSKNGEITKTCFSQWWKSDFVIDGDKYCCMEQYMMAEKARIFDDEEILDRILESRNPREIKALGRKVRNFDQEVWENSRYSIVLIGNYNKFIQNEELKEFILGARNRVLVEASPYDKVWGIGMAQDNENIENPFRWKGINLLGFALIEIRDEIKRVCQNENLIDFNQLNKDF